MNFGLYTPQQTKLIVQKHAQSGLLEGLGRTTDTEKKIFENTALVMENQMVWAENGANAANSVFYSPAMVQGSTTSTGDIGRYPKQALPIVRRYFPNLIAHHTVGVSPMPAPVSLIFYMRFRAAVTKGDQQGLSNENYTSNDAYWLQYKQQHAKMGEAGWDDTSLQQKVGGEIVLPIYFSSQTVKGEVGTLAGTTVTEGVPATEAAERVFAYKAKWTPVYGLGITPSSADVSNFSYCGLTPRKPYTMFGKITVPTSTPAEFHFAVSDFGVPSVKNLFDKDKAQVGTVAVSQIDGTITVTFDTAPTKFGAITACYAYDMEANRILPTVNLTIESTNVTAETRKLRAQFSPEGGQDLMNQHGLDLEAELSNFLSKEIALEVDRDILSDLRDNAGTVSVWNFGTNTTGSAITGMDSLIQYGGTTFGMSPFLSLKEKYETLFMEVIRVATMIRKKTLQGEANWLVVSPEIEYVLTSGCSNYVVPPSDKSGDTTMGCYYSGTANTRFKIFVDPAAPRDQILMGLKGDNMMNVGYYYCPYIPLQSTDRITDPMSGMLTKIFMTRYGKAMLELGPRYYGTITVNGLQNVTRNM